MKINQLKAGALLSYVSMGLSTVISLVYTPVMLQRLGDSEFGVYQTVLPIISYLNLLSFGREAYLSGKCLHEPMGAKVKIDIRSHWRKWVWALPTQVRSLPPAGRPSRRGGRRRSPPLLARGAAS